MANTHLYNWSVGIFLGCWLFGFFHPTTVPAGILGVGSVAWLLGFISQSITRRKHVQAVEDFRSENVKNYSRVFASSAPKELDKIHGEFVDLFDLETGLYIGRGMKRDIQTLYDAFDNEPLIFENGPNDIPLTQDFIEQIEQMDDFNLTPHFQYLMENAMDEKYLTLVTIRWVQPEEKHDYSPES